MFQMFCLFSSFRLFLALFLFTLATREQREKREKKCDVRTLYAYQALKTNVYLLLSSKQTHETEKLPTPSVELDQLTVNGEVIKKSVKLCNQHTPNIFQWNDLFLFSTNESRFFFSFSLYEKVSTFWKVFFCLASIFALRERWKMRKTLKTGIKKEGKLKVLTSEREIHSVIWM